MCAFVGKRTRREGPCVRVSGARRSERVPTRQTHLAFAPALRRPWLHLDGVFQAAYLYRMTVKTSITLQQATLKAIDKRVGKGTNRSRIIEELLTRQLAAEDREKRGARDRDLYNRHAKQINAETEDLLAYQAKV